ncbi:MAG TPA: hypothetical protein DHW71_13295 [Gammaproteobacteria bacterium]|nr:hypothetical protein [Gammaproteobacteria bacterium]MEC8011836.1 hypothetical protein [Pseudomonadota bacterium]HBF07758.1 hypothetical protein [Gammaproteobacteria bacterium]HCK93965.1 hypothetical protein [Gammaproteobacteria bacterium]
MHIEKLRTVRQFIKAQASVCLTLVLIFAINKHFEYIAAIALAVVLQWIQLYAWARPNRVALTGQWLKGVFRGVALKYLLLTIALIMLFTLMPHDYYLKYPKQFFKTALVFFAAYALPYWYLGVLSSKTKKKESDRN